MAVGGAWLVARSALAGDVEVARDHATNELTMRSCATTCAMARVPLADLGKAEIAHRTFRFEGRAFEHITLARTGARFESIIAHGASSPVFAGVTGLVGDPGERAGVLLTFIGETSDPTRVDLATLRDDTRVCGEPDPSPLATRTLRGTRFVQTAPAPLSKLRAANALATVHGAPFATASVTILTPTSGSSNEVARAPGGSANLAQGEFVTLHAPKLAIERLRLTFAPAPVERSLWLASRKSVYRLALPKGATEVVAALPAAEMSTCWSLVAAVPVELHGASAHPALFERATTPSDLAALIVASDRDAIEAAEALRVFGTQGAVALDARMNDIPERLLTHVEGALSAMLCEALISPMAKLSVRARGTVATRARHQLERCARPALGEAVKVLSEPSPHALLLGDVLSRTAPKEVCDAMLRWPGATAAALRRKARVLLSRVADRCDAQTIEAELARAEGDRRTDLLAAFRNRTRDLSANLLAGALAALRGDFESGWMAVRALESLASAGDQRALAALEATAKTQADAHLRALACRGLSEGRGSRDVLLGAVRDPAPRVREAALLSLQRVDGEEAIAAAKDPWAFVRQAAAARVGDPKLLGALLGDRVADVRIAAIRAVAAGKRAQFVTSIVSILRNRRETTGVRREAASTLGALCATDALAGLEEVAASAARGVESDRELAVDALRAIAVLDEARALDLSKRWPARAAVSLAAEARDARRTGTCKPHERR